MKSLNVKLGVNFEYRLVTSDNHFISSKCSRAKSPELSQADMTEPILIQNTSFIVNRLFADYVCHFWTFVKQGSVAPPTVVRKTQRMVYSVSGYDIKVSSGFNSLSLLHSPLVIEVDAARLLPDKGHMLEC